ncbi:MAG: hypothetical protein IPL72_19495 [Sulfuritalea sp.]|nr:hypothetical protein [Sulfuritalea sp.]
MAILPVPETLSMRLIAVRRGLLLAMLAALYLVLWQGPHSLLTHSRSSPIWGCSMLWQPFVQTERRLSPTSLMAVGGACWPVPTLAAG